MKQRNKKIKIQLHLMHKFQILKCTNVRVCKVEKYCSVGLYDVHKLKILNIKMSKYC